ncbi:hypothetical protein Bca52824_020848 [Brassica carinata]|uniref:F-box associated beta-propeller type 1 domain-containing protein n=1 Tax=Brassica carinata TaxID=52824 RepID=A0A8X7VUJ6_BRACI|nr:hypothetical protein Bca52824_020848 [Brassica carinata]
MLTLPELPIIDLEKKILAYFPKRSPSQWQTVCKRWYTLRRDLLAKKHLAQAGRELILLLNSSVFSTTINLQEIHNNVNPSMEFGGKLGSLQDANDLKIHDIFYCKGLILCTMVGNEMIVVCNPSNGETRYVEPRTFFTTSDSYALGYEAGESSCIDSYKILRYRRYYNIQLMHMVYQIELYEFKYDSWRVLNILDDNHGWDISARGVSVNGNTYWFAKHDDEDYFHFILTFDFTRERFDALTLPYENDDADDILNDQHEDTAVLSVVRDEQLSVLHQCLHRYSFEMKIWVSNSIDTREVSWGEFLVVDVVFNIVSFLLDEEHKVAVCCSTDKDDDKEECMNLRRAFLQGALRKPKSHPKQNL